MPNLSTFMSQTHEYNEVYPQSLKVLDKNSFKQLSKLTAGKTFIQSLYSLGKSKKKFLFFLGVFKNRIPFYYQQICDFDFALCKA